MPSLDLTEQEHALLRELLESSYTDLRQEIADTDTSTFKDVLKEREQRLQAILAKLGARPG